MIQKENPDAPDYRLEEFLPLLKRADDLRAALHDCTANLIDKVNDSPADVRHQWHQFLQLGGSTAVDLQCYLRGEKLHRYQHGASKGYGRLRLVNDYDDDGDRAATG